MTPAIPQPPQPDSVIAAFYAPVPPDDVPRFEQMAADLRDWLSRSRHYGGSDTIQLWQQPAETARAFDAALACMAEAGDVEPDWSAADAYPIERVQAWCAMSRPGIVVAALAYELAAEWFTTYGTGFSRPSHDIHGDRLPPRPPTGPSRAGEVIEMPIARWFKDMTPAKQAIERAAQAEMRRRGMLESSERITNLAERLRADPPAPEFDWGDRVPRDEVTLLGAHGGSGKSTLALVLAACAAAGRECLSLPTRPQVAAYYSAEDPAAILLHRLGKVCRELGIDPAEIEGRLHLFDMTGGDPVLYRAGNPTARLDWLREQVQTLGVGLLIVDGASDTFDDNEISRPHVRGFMRSLRGLDCTVILVAHIDKQAAKGNGGDQNYSGSTAWNNSARSRLALLPNTDGTMELVHEKSNHGTRQAPLRLTWCNGLPALASDGATTGEDPTRALLALIHEFNTRGEYIGTGNTSTSNAYRLLSKEPTFPRHLSRADVFYQLRQAERAGYLSNLEYKTQDRKTRKRWELTETGKALIAPTVAPATVG
jgi:hypothetical protein